jgi:putative ABC transport system permease protein
VKIALMLSNYVKVATKVLLRRKFFTAISLFGIAFTLTVLLVVAAMVDHLLAPDSPETRLDRTLHVTSLKTLARDGDEEWWFRSSPGYELLDRYMRDIPGVEKMSIYSKLKTVTSFVNGEKVVSDIRRTDGAYWEILDFEFLEGGPFTQEDDDNAAFVAVITETTRRRYFGDQPALGRTFEADGLHYRVVGVVENVPITRMSAVADVWTPHGTARSRDMRDAFVGGYYSSRGFQALLLARSRSEIGPIKDEFESRLAHVELQPPYYGMQGVPLTRLEQFVVDMTSIKNNRPRTVKAMLIWLSMIAAFLLLPTTNLITVNMSRFMERASEIGVRKTFGASSAHLVGQFVVENVFLCLIGGALSLAGAAAVMAAIESSGLLPYADLEINFRVFLYGTAIAVFFGLLSGAWPAWRTSRLHPVEALRGGGR